MDLHTQTAIEFAMINLRAIVRHQQTLTGYQLQGHPFEAGQAASALATLGRLLLEDQAELEELSRITIRQFSKLLEFAEHENVRRA